MCGADAEANVPAAGERVHRAVCVCLLFAIAVLSEGLRLKAHPGHY